MQPGTGRFWSQDSYEGSSSDPQSLHKYLYAGADPANMVDPSGHFFSVAEVAAANSIRSTLANIQGIQGQAILDGFKDGGESALDGLIFGAVAGGLAAGIGVLAGKLLTKAQKAARLELLKAVRVATQSANPNLQLTGQVARRYKNVLKHFEKDVFDDAGRVLTDFDVELDNAIIEVTNGIGRGKPGQLANRIIPNANKPVIFFGPKVTSAARLREIEATGAIVVNTLEELDAIVKSLHP